MQSYQDFFRALENLGTEQGLEIDSRFHYKGGGPAQLRDHILRSDDREIFASLIACLFGTKNSTRGTVRAGKEAKYSEAVKMLLDRAQKYFEMMKKLVALASLVSLNTMTAFFPETALVAKNA